MRFRTILVAALLVGAFVYFTSSHNLLTRFLPRPDADMGPLWSGPDVAHSAGFDSDEQNNIEIYETAHQATVNITSTVLQRNWFYEIYPRRESGSGFIIDDEGRILTNNHVISGRAPQIQVTLADRSRHDAEVLVRDTVSDLALIKINPDRKLPFLKLGDSDSIQVGQKVLAIGNPFGLQGTLTTGIISSLGRTIQDENGRELEDMIQTDAAINPGNSGGPLLDSQGNVIGINTAIYGPGGNIGIGFAMPVNAGKRMLEDFRAGRRVGRPVLGVSGSAVSGDIAEMLDLPREGGFLIYEVTRNSAAARIRLRGARRRVVIRNYEVYVGGDLIMAIDGQVLDRAETLTRILRRHRPGDEVELTIFRDGSRMNVKVELGSAE